MEYTQETLVAELAKIKPNLTVLSNINELSPTGALSKHDKTRIEVHCNACGDEYARNIHQLLFTNNSCQRCYHLKRHPNMIKSHAEFVNIITTKYPNLTILNQYTGTSCYIDYTCTCGFSDSKLAYSMIYQGQGCKKCKKSRGGVGTLNLQTETKLVQRGITTPSSLYLTKLTHKDTGDVSYKVGVTTQALCRRHMNIRFLSNCHTDILQSVQCHKHPLLVYIESMFGVVYNNNHKHFSSTEKWMGSGEVYVFNSDTDAINAFNAVIQNSQIDPKEFI